LTELFFLSQEILIKTLIQQKQRLIKQGLPVEKKAVFTTAFISVLLLLVAVGAMVVDLTTANIIPVDIPEHSIEIGADGSVIGTHNIQRNGTVYTFTGDVLGTIVISCDGIVIDGAGHRLTGNGSSCGFFLQGRRGVTIQNVQISNFGNGIRLTWWFPSSDKSNLPNNIFQNNTITNNVFSITANGVWVGGCTISSNLISNSSEEGIGVSGLSSLIISGNQLLNNKMGLNIRSCRGNVSNNIFSDNELQVSCDATPETTNSSLIQWYNNCWSDYFTKYTNASEIGDSGIGDTPYIIDANNIDNYPFIPRHPELPSLEPQPEPFPTTLVATVSVTTAVLVSAGLLVYFKKRKHERESYNTVYTIILNFNTVNLDTVKFIS
jgi:hypothetical protein